MNARPSVAAIIPTFNRSRFLGEALASLLGQTDRLAQIIVVNDGSTDDTDSVVEPFRSRIEYLKKENGGKSTALNAALPRVRADLVWIFDDDDVALPNALESHLAVLSGAPSAGFSYSPFRWFEGGGAGSEISGRLAPLPDCRETGLFIQLLEGCCISQQGMIVRRTCLEAVGPFDVRYVRGQDYEMILRLARLYAGAPVSEPTYLRRVHDGSRGGTIDLHRAAERSTRWFAYEQMMVRELRDKLRIDEYLPEHLRPLVQAPRHRRRAYLQRAAVMARRGLWEETVADLSDALAIFSGPLEDAERRICTAAFDSAFAPLAIGQAPDAISRIADLCSRRPPGREMRAHFARGLVFAARAMAREGEVAKATEILRLVPRLAGTYGMAWLAARKLGLAA